MVSKTLAFTEIGTAGKGRSLVQIISTLIWDIQMESPSRQLIIYMDLDLRMDIETEKNSSNEQHKDHCFQTLLQIRIVYDTFCK